MGVEQRLEGTRAISGLPGSRESQRRKRGADAKNARRAERRCQGREWG